MPIWEQALAHEWRVTPRQHAIMIRNSALNEALYRLCDHYPDHRSRPAIRAKLVIIGRTYATGLERHVDSVDAVTTILFRARSWLDEGITRLRGVRDHLPCTERIVGIARLHGRLQRALGSMTRGGNSVRSFVSKYLHFHAPVVPLYDRYANAAMTDWYRWPPSHDAPKKPTHADDAYWRHLVRTAFVVDEWRRTRVRAPTAREIDSYAIAWWETQP